MKFRARFVLALLATFASTLGVLATSPISNVQVTLRGKKYDVEDVTTVAELQERLQEASGVAPKQQGRLLFQGKRLDSQTTLEEAGVKTGDQLNCVPGGSSSSTSSSASGKSKLTPKAEPSSASASASSSSNLMKDFLDQSGLDTSQLNEMVQNMSGGAGGEAPSMQESMEMMSSMMNSPIFQEYMSDPARLEESRQMILNNPMLKQMMSGMPGMEDLINSPDAWREAMQAAASMYQNMDQNELLQAMMGGAGAAGAGMPPGLFDDQTAASPELAALDELSEGED